MAGKKIHLVVAVVGIMALIGGVLYFVTRPRPSAASPDVEQESSTIDSTQ